MAKTTAKVSLDTIGGAQRCAVGHNGGAAVMRRDALEVYGRLRQGVNLRF